MPDERQKDTDPVFVLKVPGGTIEGRDAAVKWAGDALESQLANLDAATLGRLMALLRCRTALQEIGDKRRHEVDAERVEPLDQDKALEMLREV